MHIQSIFNADYFMSQLEDAGIVKKSTSGKTDQKTLLKVPNLTVGLVLAAKGVGIFSDSDIVKWIKKYRKIVPRAIIEVQLPEQLLKYNELANYLMNEVEESDTNKWKDTLNKTLYIWPSSGNEENWSKVFGDKVPEICNKIDNNLKLKVESPLDHSAGLIKKEIKDECIPKKEKVEKYDVKLKSENENKEQIKEVVGTSINMKNLMNENLVKESEDIIKDESDKSSLSENDELEDVKLKSENENKEQIKDIETSNNSINFNDEDLVKESEDIIKDESDKSSLSENEELEDVKLKSENENKEKNKDNVEASSNMASSMNENLVKESDDTIEDESDRSLLGEGDDQLDFLFNEDEELDYNEDEELDYEYDSVIGQENEELNEKDMKQSEKRENEELNEKDMKQSENRENEMEMNEDEELDYEYDATIDDENEELNENDMKQSEKNENEVENNTNLDNEDGQKNIEDCSNDDELDFDFNCDDLVVVDAEGDSDEHDSHAKTEDEDNENSRDWRIRNESSSNKDHSKISAKDKDAKYTTKHKDRESSKSEKEKLPERFEKVVVIADKLYKKFVAPLNSKNNKVVLIADDELTIKSLPGILERNKHKGEENALWIIVTGMYNLIKIKDPYKLKKVHIPHVDNIEIKKFSVSAIIKEGKEMRRTIKSSLGATCAVVSCPPIPAALLVNQKDPMKDLSYDIGRFTKEWTRMTCDFFEQHKLAYNYKKIHYLSMHNVGGIHQIRFERDDRLDHRNSSWKMLLNWYEIIEGIIRFNVNRGPSKPESSQSKSSSTVRSRSSSRKRDDKSTSRSESTRREKSDLQTTSKEQSNSSEKETDKDAKVLIEEVNDSIVAADDNLILKESIEPSEDLLVVVIGEENVARNFCKIKIPKVRFKIVILRNYYYKDINKLIPGNHLQSENILWVVLFDLPKLYMNKISFCKRFYPKLRCKDELYFAAKLESDEVAKKCTMVSNFVDEIIINLGKNSFVFLAPVIPQTVLHCQSSRAKIAEFHAYVHQTEELKGVPIFRPAADKEDIISNYKLFEKEWLKGIENVMRKQNLNFEFISDYEKKKGKVFEVLSDPRKYRSRNESYKEWEGFMEALIITFNTSICDDDKLTKETKNVNSEKTEGDKVMDDGNKVDSESLIEKESYDSNNTVAYQINIENVPNGLKNEDFEKILNVCGEVKDVKYKKKGTLFLFREALVTFMNANSVFHAFHLLNGKYILHNQLSGEVINKDSYGNENCDGIDLMLKNCDNEFVNKAAETINDIIKNLKNSMVEESKRDSKEKSENKHKDYKQEKQHDKFGDASKDKENKNSRSSSVSSGNLKRKSGEMIESKDGDRSKSPKSLKSSQSSERKKKSSKSPEKQHRAKSPERTKRARSIKNRKSRSCSPNRKKNRSDKLRDNEVQFTNINYDDREIMRLMTHFLAQFGGSKVRLERLDKRTVFRFKNANVAKMLSKLLSNFRFPDKHLKIIGTDDTTTSSEVNKGDLQFVAMHLDLVLKRIPHFPNYLDEVHSLWPGAFNLFTFKTKKCFKTHPVDGPLHRVLCVNFHGFTDSRRDPRDFDYEAETCPESWKSKNAKKLVCPAGKECKFSHTTMERVFHMSTLKKHVCMEWYQTQSCNADRFCAGAHPETPEVLFHDVWRDVYLSGLEKTYHYLVGAVQNLRHVLLTSQYGSGMQILVVTPSVYEVQWLTKAIWMLAQDHKLKVATATDHEWETGKSDIVIATPGGAVKLLYSHSDASKNLKGLIIDDIGVILQEHKFHLASMAQTLINQRGAEDIQLNRVVVSETIYQDEVDRMANVLQTEFTVLGTAVPGSPPQMHVDILTDLSHLVSSGNTLVADDPGVKRKMSELGLSLPEEPPMRRTPADPRSDVRADERIDHKRQQHRESPSKSSQRARSPIERRQNASPGHRRARSPGSTRRSRSPVARSRWPSPGKNRARPPSPRGTREHRGEFGRFDRSRDSRSSPERGRRQRDSRSRSRPRESPRSNSQNRSFSPRSSRNWPLDNKKLQSGSSIYENMPHGGGPSDFSSMPRNGGVGFNQGGIIGGGGGSSLPVSDASSLRPTASTPWSSGLPQTLATSDWRDAVPATVTAPERSSSSSSSVFHNRNVGQPNFDTRMEAYPKREVLSIYDTCAMLTTVCDHLGIIGISFKTTLQGAMEFKSNSSRMLDTFREPEVMSLMEVVVKKIKEMVDKSSDFEREQCKEYLYQMNVLIERTKSLSQQPEASKKVLYGLDIESIAKVTIGKDNPFVINDIKNRLLDAHGRVDSDQFSEIYKAVSMLQFDMMIDNPSSGGTKGTQPAIGKRESPDRNPGMFTQDSNRFNPQVKWDSKQGTEKSIAGGWEKPTDVSTHNFSVNDRWEQGRQGVSDSNRGLGNNWEGKRFGDVEPNRDSWENIQQRPAISSDRERVDNWEITKNTRSDWGSKFTTEGTNNSSSNDWRQGTIQDMEQILGSSLRKGGNWPSQTEQNSANYSSGSIQNRPGLPHLEREPEGSWDNVGSNVNRWEQDHGLGSASSNPESEWKNSRAAPSEHIMGSANWEHTQGPSRGSAGTWMQPPTEHGSATVDRRQPADFNKQQGLQSFAGSDIWNNSVEKDAMDRNVVDYGHLGSTLSDRKVVDYGHQKGQASVNSSYGNHDNSANRMDSRYQTDPGPQQPFSSVGSNEGSVSGPPFRMTQSAPRGSQYASEEQFPRMPYMGKKIGEPTGSSFSDQLEPRFSDQGPPVSRFNDLPDTRFGHQLDSRFDEHTQPGSRFGSRPRETADKWY